jgi:hypothetical protein
MVITKQGTHKCNQRSPKRTYLLDDALYHAVGAHCDLPIASPSDIENATDGMYEVKYKKGELPRIQYHIIWKWALATTKTYHVNIGGNLKQLPVTICLSMT